LVAAARRGELAAARAEARALAPLVRALFAEPNPAVIKAALHAQGLIATADVRLPLVRASEDAVARAADVLARVEPAEAALARAGETHLRNVFGKLGVSSRVAVAVAGERHAARFAAER
ncbi:dihydrodipicolinate synthase family protein, partial [Conexibacter stalactiti]